jgi:2-polyprenyl-3-methyl-5-hydroxy-6-metoxy-1,4-benzoquinol methylase
MSGLSQQTYEESLQIEGRIWSANADSFYRVHPPDWRYLRELNDYWLKRRDVEGLLERIHPADSVLELGCGAGWLSLELARHGADVTALDIAAGALAIGRSYYEHVRQTETFRGFIDYRLADINRLESISSKFDWIVAMGVLHHVPNPRELLASCQHLLKPGGRLFVSDPLNTTPQNSLINGIFLMLLPTNLSYGEKLRLLMRVRRRAVQRMGIAIEGRDASPFEGVGRTDSPAKIASEFFEIEYYHEGYATTAFLSRELNAPRWVARALLRLISPLDWLLVKLGLLRGLHYLLIGRTRPQAE